MITARNYIRVLIHGICVFKQIGIANHILGKHRDCFVGRMVKGYEFEFLKIEFVIHGSMFFGAVHPQDPRDHAYISRNP